MSDETPVEETPAEDAFVGVDEQYQNYANEYDKPLKAPGEDDEVFTPQPEPMVLVDPDFDPNKVEEKDAPVVYPPLASVPDEVEDEEVEEAETAPVVPEVPQVPPPPPAPEQPTE